MTNEARKAAMQRIANNMSPANLAKAERLRDLYGRHVTSPRDVKVQELYDRLLMNTQVGESKLAGLVFMGQSGSGKTHAIRMMESLPDFQPYRVHEHPNFDMLPYITLDAPSDSAPNVLMAEIIKACGFPVSKPGNIADMTSKAFEWFEKRRVMFVHIDEFQHALKTSTEIQIQKIQDAIKELIQISAPWPVQIILSGTPLLANFRKGDDQLRNRTLPLEFESLDVDRDSATVLVVAQGVISKHAGLRHKGLNGGDFSHRLLKSANFQFGNVIDVTRLACDFAISEDTETVSVDHFARVYSLMVSVRTPEENMFLSEDWKQIRIPNSIIDGAAFEVARKKRRTFRAKLK